MVVFSLLRPLNRVANNLASKVVLNQTRSGGHYTMATRPSRWGWDKFKDDVHWYFMLGAIPVGAFVTLTNVFVGPAVLTPIPEGYHPREEEYHRNPVTRFMVRHFKKSFQELYEVGLYNRWEINKITEMRGLKKEVKRQMAIHGDYKGWYHRADIGYYVRVQRANNEAEGAVRSPMYGGSGVSEP